MQVQSDRLISTDKVAGASVVDNQNKDVGDIESIFVDPQSGKIQRVDIDFNTGTGKTYSVKWDDLNVTQKDNGDVVARVDQSVIRRVKKAEQNNKD